jgi:hypothetical protein
MVERARDEGELPVESRTQTVRRADLAAFAAADKSPVQSCHVRRVLS